MMDSRRKSGVLLHPTSLPGPYGIGEIGPDAYRFADTLKEMGQHLWQILPMGPTSYADSPYQSLSTFAGNPLLISLDVLFEDGLVAASRLKRFRRFGTGDVDYGSVIPARMDVLRSVCRGFRRRASAPMTSRYEAFCERNAGWLEDYALFISLKDAHGGGPWVEWGTPLRDRDAAELRRARRHFATAMRNAVILQFLFFDQWERLLTHCRRLGIQIIGDIPIFVAHDSSDVWAHRDLFHLADDGQPTYVAGVPPDYFSETGQRWGNPLYRWDRHEQTGYAWWIERMDMAFRQVDILRIDHFRGFESYWEIPADEPTAVHGAWVPGPGEGIFNAMRDQLGELPIIAEDLGVITPKVEALRRKFNFPGMHVLQFVLPEEHERHAPHHDHDLANRVCYTGTHDNDTTVGWFARNGDSRDPAKAEEARRRREAILRRLGSDGSEIHWDLIRLAFESPCRAGIVPLQDVLGLDSRSRMNMPGTTGGNWRWRFRWDQLDPGARQRLRSLTDETGRSGTAE